MATAVPAGRALPTPSSDSTPLHAPRLRVVGVGERIDRRRLVALDPIERGLQARDGAGDAASAGDELARARIGRRAAAGQQEGALVLDQGAFERSRARLARRAIARGMPDRAGDVAQAAERARARFQRRLPAENLVELLLVLLLVQQLAARNAVDPGAQLGDAILVAELHVACRAISRVSTSSWKAK